MQLQAHTAQTQQQMQMQAQQQTLTLAQQQLQHRHRHRLLGQINSSGSFKETTNDFKQSWPGSNLLRVRRLLLLLFPETAANAFADWKAMNSAAK